MKRPMIVKAASFARCYYTFIVILMMQLLFSAWMVTWHSLPLILKLATNHNCLECQMLREALSSIQRNETFIMVVLFLSKLNFVIYIYI